jgi:pilus assembly protein CpaC
MFMPKKIWISGTVLFGLASILLIFSASTRAGDNIQPEIQKPRIGIIELAVGKSDFLPIPEAVKKSDHIRVTLGDPEIADFIFIPKASRRNKVRNIYIKGIKQGATTLTLWKNGELFCIYDVHVYYDVSLLKRKLHDILPDEKDIRVFSTKDSITLLGTVSSNENLNQALVLAKAFVEENKIINLLNTAGAQQVMLEVRVAEMSKRVTNRLGINFNWVKDTGEFGISLLGGVSSLYQEEDTGLMNILFSDDATGLLRLESGGNTWTGIFDFLKGNQLIKILAEPTLIALSGQTANFLAGGEFPIPEIDDEGNIGVEYKPYGVNLAFTPTVLSAKRIAIKVQPVISELDYSQGLTVGGTSVPGILSRSVSTMVELGDGQSFAIAGILQESSRENLSKYPGLGDIPVLGALFKSKSYQKNETELVIIVTPHLVKPLNMAEQSLPTDFYIDPDDAEFYLWGVFGKSHEAYGEAELDGEFGHIFEKN